MEEASTKPELQAVQFRFFESSDRLLKAADEFRKNREALFRALATVTDRKSTGEVASSGQ